MSSRNCGIFHNFSVELFRRHPGQCGTPWSLNGMVIEWFDLNQNIIALNVSQIESGKTWVKYCQKPWAKSGHENWVKPSQNIGSNRFGKTWVESCQKPWVESSPNLWILKKLTIPTTGSRSRIRHGNERALDIAAEHSLFVTIVMLHRTVDIAVDVYVAQAMMGRIPFNRALERSPGGIVRTGRLESVAVWVIWSCRYTVWPSIRTDYSCGWIHGQTLPLQVQKILFLVKSCTRTWELPQLWTTLILRHDQIPVGTQALLD